MYGLFFGPSNSIGSAPDCGGRASRARDAVGFSCANTPVQTDTSRQVNRKNFLNMTSGKSVATGTTLSACGFEDFHGSSKVGISRCFLHNEKIFLDCWFVDVRTLGRLWWRR